MPQGGNQFLGAFNQNQIRKKNTDQQIYNNNKGGILHNDKRVSMCSRRLNLTDTL